MKIVWCKRCLVWKAFGVKVVWRKKCLVHKVWCKKKLCVKGAWCTNCLAQKVSCVKTFFARKASRCLVWLDSLGWACLTWVIWLDLICSALLARLLLLARKSRSGKGMGNRHLEHHHLWVGVIRNALRCVLSGSHVGYSFTRGLALEEWTDRVSIRTFVLPMPLPFWWQE